MPLEMRNKCERCGKELKHDSEVRICSFECTFCEDCSRDMNHKCPNCGGELVPRPIRKK